MTGVRAAGAPIRVLLVDDQALVRSGFRIILESEPDIEVVGEAETGAQAVALAATLAPDVICMDVEMPEMNGIDASRAILAAPGAASAVLVLTTFGHDEYLFDALAAGVSGFLLKTSRAEQLIDAVRVVAAGGSLLGPEVTGAVLARVRRAEAPSAAAPGAAATNADDALETAMTDAGLTPRERAVLVLLAEGRTNAEIAGELFLGEATVKTHVSNVLQKLEVRDRLQAVVWAHTRA
ncbi:response regulator [Leucobacter aridicollis]|uniref:DNA-binding NarL/FixJ family response regulator n=1 Tax=Leucobacter aridicollis TaxID=283878 RepID=A0A852RFJ2_9MICO|nr:response regulator transcription factor [Leucobacter aridicollis]MBL3680871.1 DNA-binding response regulator [Leucobacter aridicollis]NYD28126.1 DNA-binding NarL/FixJ family response regulator [Leucobacter aridicollis]